MILRMHKFVMRTVDAQNISFLLCSLSMPHENSKPSNFLLVSGKLLVSDDFKGY